MHKTKAFVMAALVTVTAGCCNTPTQTRMTAAAWDLTHSQLATPVYNSEYIMAAGEQLRLPLVENTTWKSTNQRILMVGQTADALIITALKPGKAQFHGFNVYDSTKNQTVTVVVK